MRAVKRTDGKKTKPKRISKEENFALEHGHRIELKKVKAKSSVKKKTVGSVEDTRYETLKEPRISKIIVKYDVGFGNQLFVRGSNAGLSWEKGVMMKNVGADEWMWETSEPFSNCEFKVLINDNWYEGGENRQLTRGASVQYTPNFY